ncbi:hypothetical protein D9757_009541 [Collybiopsis confluens]|uniref:Uncharacterized protein n=1 Tax=Collybiopsis confluens TaxID=2823264 RepID=A0A8H5H818_9AGAR|nr:hypothetical protein D9757_009541 [Collybiopsis confluens]
MVFSWMMFNSRPIQTTYFSTLLILLIAPYSASEICSGYPLGIGNVVRLANGGQWPFFDNACNVVLTVNLTADLNPCNNFFSCSPPPVTFTAYVNQTDGNRREVFVGEGDSEGPGLKGVILNGHRKLTYCNPDPDQGSSSDSTSTSTITSSSQVPARTTFFQVSTSSASPVAAKTFVFPSSIAEPTPNRGVSSNSGSSLLVLVFTTGVALVGHLQ